MHPAPCALTINASDRLVYVVVRSPTVWDAGDGSTYTDGTFTFKLIAGVYSDVDFDPHTVYSASDSSFSCHEAACHIRDLMQRRWDTARRLPPNGLRQLLTPIIVGRAVASHTQPTVRRQSLRSPVA